jgi:hypothetical protein
VSLGFERSLHETPYSIQYTPFYADPHPMSFGLPFKRKICLEMKNSNEVTEVHYKLHA